MTASPENFNDNPGLIKSVTNREGAGLGPGNINSFTPTTAIKSYNVSVQQGPAISDVIKTFTGPHSGAAGGSSILASPKDNYGWVSPSGSAVKINGGAGGDSLELIHNSGASIMIDVDGAIFIQPTGRKGFGLNASTGDGVVAAQQRIVIKGNSGITLETEGDLEFNVGKNVIMDVGGDFALTVGGATSIQTDGSLTVEAVSDYNEMVGGIKRVTVAGDYRNQVAGNLRNDVGQNFESRTDGDTVMYSQKSVFINSKESSSFEVDTGKLNLLSKDDITIGSQKSAYIQTDDDITFESADSVAIRSGGNMVLSSKGNLYNDAEGSIENRSTSSTQDVSGPYVLRSTSANFNSTGALNIVAGGASNYHAAGAVDMKGSTIDFNKSGSPTSPAAVLPQETTTPRSAPAAFSPSPAEYPDAKTMLDNMTSERQAPDFPQNAKKMSEDEMSIYKNEGDEPNPSAYGMAAGNRGAGSPFRGGGFEGTLEDSGNPGYDGSNNNSRSQASGYPLPSSLLNSNEKISRFVTVGMFGNLSFCPSSQMGLSRQQILQNVAHLCTNILDPVIEKFGNKVRLNPGGAGLRIGRGRSMHYLGKACDISSSSRNHAETAEIARWIVENLPYDRVFLEANASGGVHIHVEAAPQGEVGRRTVWTCADPQCFNRVNGLQLSYARQGLARMGYRVG